MASERMELLKEKMKIMLANGFAPSIDGEIDPLKLRKAVQFSIDNMPVEQGVESKEIVFNGVEGELVYKKDSDNSAIIIYIHGGGLLCGNARSSRAYASMLVNYTNYNVYTLSYRLCPEYPFPACMDDSYNFYLKVLQDNPNTPIFLIGESGGAYLSLVTAMLSRDNNIKMPAGIVLYSTPIDFECRINREFEGNKDFTVKSDGMEALTKWLDPNKEFVNDKYFNPYLDDLSNLPPTLISFDESESLSVDSKIMIDKFEKNQKKDYEVYSYPDCFHAFQTVGKFIPEGKDILEKTSAFFNKYKQN